MEFERLEKLTERQRECLRLVLRHYTSKEMARELGIGVDAVDQRLKGAMRKLGANSRLEAARALAAHEGMPAIPPEQSDVSQSVAFHHSRAASVAIIMEPPKSRRRILAGIVKRLLPRTRRGRFVLIACLLGLASGLVGAFLPIDLFLRDRNVAAHLHPASGEIISVEIDRKSVEALGLTPWPRHHMAQIFRRLDEMGASKVVCWLTLERPGDAEGDRELASQVQSMGGRVVFVVDTEGDPSRGPVLLPLPEFRSRAVLAQGLTVVILWTVRRTYYHYRYEGRNYPSAMSELANAHFDITPSRFGRLAGVEYDSFPIDYTIDARTIPSVSAIDVIRGNVPRSLIAGKAVSLAISYRPAPFELNAPGIRDISLPQIRVIAAETLIQGVPEEVPWTITFFPAMLLVIACSLLRRALVTLIAFSGSIVGLLLLPTILFPSKIYIDITPALFLLLLAGAGFTWSFVNKARRSRRQAEADMRCA